MRAGTREHMLGESQPDIAHYPSVSLRCRRVTATPAGVVLELTVTLRGHEESPAVPVQWQQTDEALQANGEITFKQSDLGLEPYSGLLSALRVADEIKARFQFVAHRS